MLENRRCRSLSTLGPMIKKQGVLGPNDNGFVVVIACNWKNHPWFYLNPSYYRMVLDDSMRRLTYGLDRHIFQY